MPNRKIRVLIVEDHPATRLGLKFALENAADIEVSGEAGSGAEALAQARLLLPDVVLLDYRLPDMSGAEVAAALHQAGLEAGILAYSGFADEQHIIPILNAGALGFVVKTEPPEAILEAVRAAARREPWLSQEAYALVMRFRRGGAARMPAPDGAGAGGAGRAARRLQQPPDRRGALDFGGHGKEPPDQYLRQAGRQRPGRGDRLGLAARSGGAVAPPGAAKAGRQASRPNGFRCRKFFLWRNRKIGS